MQCHNVLGYTLDNAIKILNKNRYEYEVKRYATPQIQDTKHKEVVSRVVRIEQNNNKFKIIVCDF